MSPARPAIAALCLLLAAAVLTGCDEPPPPTVNLYRAVHTGDLDQIKRHLFWRTDINQPGPDGNYPLHVAVRQAQVPIARELIRNGARLDVKDSQGRTPLHLALAHGKVPAAKLLVEYGAEDDLQALLFDLVRANAADRDTLAFLTQRGVDINAAGPDGEPALHSAVIAGNMRLAKRLITAGADVNRPDAAGRTPLALADAGSEPALIPLLSQYGAHR